MKPYGYVRKDGEGVFIYGEHQFQNAMGAELVPVYLHPNEWVELTDEEIKAVWKKLDYDMSHGKFATCGTHYVIVEFARAMFAKSKEKNT